jgi:alpha-glucosidase
MNEPAVGGSYLPDNLCFDFDGRRGNALEAKNLYGMLMARSSFESGLRYGHGRRPFILTRSGFAGVQRYSAMWTGDNTAKDEFLTGGVLLNTQMGLSGIAFVGDDIGGYIGPTSKELFIRWMQTGSFSPFMRNHKEAYSHANEPWSYGEEAEGISREFTEFRYRLLPYTYSIFYESSCSGMPVARSLAINNPHDPKVYHPVFQYQFLFGDAILVTPVTSRETSKIVYLPEGEWYDLYSDEKTTGKKEINMDCPLHKIPLFVRASSVIPMQSRIESTKEYPSDTLFLHLYFGNTGNIFEYYEDDGISFEYQSGVFYKRKISFLPPDRMIRLSVPEGSYHSKFRVVECILHGFPDDLKQINVDGRQMTLYEESSLIIDGLRYLEDLYIPEYYRSLRAAGNTGIQKSFSFENGNKEIKITW